MEQAPPLLSAKQVCRTHQDQKLLSDVDVDVNDGERIAIVGQSGSGKTLLLRALCWLDPLQAGEVRWNGSSLMASQIPEFRSQAIYLAQRPVLPEGSVEEILRVPFGMAIHRSRSYSNTVIKELLEVVGKSDVFLQRHQNQLSGGEAQIVALIRAIQLQPKVLLLDEPTSALDENSTKLVESLIDRWHSEPQQSRAFVWVTHDLAQARRISSRCFEMSNGELSELPGDTNLENDNGGVDG